MSYQARYLLPQIQEDLQRKMVFLGGPRQVGKTTLGLHLAGGETGYLSWDDPEHRERILKRKLPETPLWIFDEIHKYRGWRNYLKGVFDLDRKRHQILVTGSARLDLYRRGGDSLQGRYHYLRLHPFSAAELNLTTVEALLALLNRGGFPEPYFESSDVQAKRWSREYRQRFIQEDLLSLEKVQDVGTIEHLILRLPDLVGSPLSINALREDLQVSHKAVANWLSILERLYLIFRLSPFGAPAIRAVKKEQKHYHYDWSVIEKDSLRFENMVGSHLLKWVHFQEDTQAKEWELRYFRDVDGREVDFIIVEKKHPILAVECKWNDDEMSKSLKYFKQRFPECEAWQVSAVGKENYTSAEGIRVSPALNLLKMFV